MTKTAHGYIENVEFTAAEDGDGLWTVSVRFCFSCPSEIRLPVTFSILGKAMTRLVSFSGGSSRQTFSLTLDHPVESNPLSFIGTRETEAMLRLDGETVTGNVSFS